MLAIDAIENSGYVIDQKNAFMAEVYNKERFYKKGSFVNSLLSVICHI